MPYWRGGGGGRYYQQQGPYIFGYAPGAQTGFSTLPASLNQWQTQPANGGYSTRTMTTTYSSQPQQTRFRSNRQVVYSGNPWQYSSGGGAVTTSASSSSQPGSVDLQSTANGEWAVAQQNSFGSVPYASSGVQEVTGWDQTQAQPAQQQAQVTWSAPSYTPAWTNQAWNANWNNGGGWYAANSWSGAAPAAAAAVTTTAGEAKAVDTSSATVTTGAAPGSGWVAGAPTWRKSYTPLPGQTGCFNKCRPNCRTAQPWGYGCQASCRSGCNLRPSCGLRGNAQVVGNTMVCGRNMGGRRISNVSLGGWSYVSQNNPNQNLMWGGGYGGGYNGGMAAAASNMVPARAAAPKQAGDDGADDAGEE